MNGSHDTPRGQSHTSRRVTSWWSRIDDVWTDVCFAVEALVIAPLVVLTCTSIWFLWAAVRFACHGCRAPTTRVKITAQPTAVNTAAIAACPTLNARLHFPWWAWSGSAVNMIFSIVGRFGLPAQHVTYVRYVLRRADAAHFVEVDVLEADGTWDNPTQDSSVDVRLPLSRISQIPSSLLSSALCACRCTMCLLPPRRKVPLTSTRVPTMFV